MGKKNKKPHFHVAAALIWQEGELLIAKRPPASHLGGLWEFPGGKREQGDTLKDCLEREIQEELGLKVKADDRILTVHHEYETKKISLHIFNCVQWTGKPTSKQRQELKWVRPVDLSRFYFPPPDEKVIEFLLCRERQRT